MKAIYLIIILICSSCTINKTLKNADLKGFTPTSIASIEIEELLPLG